MRKSKRQKPALSPMQRRLDRYEDDVTFHSLVDIMIERLRSRVLVEQDIIDAQRLAIDLARVPLDLRRKIADRIAESRMREEQKPIPFPRDK